jgi:SAM-dependent methyltransferase
MIAAARRSLAGVKADIRPGDLRAVPFEAGRFDAALEVSGVLSELPDDESLARMIQSVMRTLRTGGVYVMAIACVEAGNGDLTYFNDEIGPVTLSDGTIARLEYVVERSDASERALHMRRTVSLTGRRGEARRMTDRYALRTYSAAAIRDVLSDLAEAELVGVRAPLSYARLDPFAPWPNGEVILAIKRVPRDA